MTELHAALADVDDCWNRIGIRGDQSCPKLPEYVHCRNCPVYASAARLLDRLPPQVELEGADAAGDAAATAGEPALRRASLLVFRLHREWLGLPTRALDEVGRASVLPLPHRRDPAVLGVTNVRGTLTVCLSLARLLGLEAAGPEPRERAGAARMLIFGGAGARGAAGGRGRGHSFRRSGAAGTLPATVAGASLKYSRGGAAAPQRGRPG